MSSKLTTDDIAESDRITREADVVLSMHSASESHEGKFDLFLKALVWISVIAYMIELSTGSQHSLQGNPAFLWLERVVASIFTIEYLWRWTDSMRERNLIPISLRHRQKSILEYPTSALGIIDLIAIMPFWVGFFVPVAWLGLVRSLRILRLLKYFRYSRSLQLVALAWYRAWLQFKALGFAMFIFGLFSMAAIYQAERNAQPEAFDGIFNSLWFTVVTVTTVGYGDMSPVTDVGKILAMLTFLPSLAVFAGLIGIFSNVFSTVLEEELDPNVDPIAKFAETREARRKAKEARRNVSRGIAVVQTVISPQRHDSTLDSDN
jgi:voltage-gated potassium channel